MQTSSLRQRWIGWRNGVLASARFQAFAARFLLTRGRARREARGLFDLVAGFTYSQVLAACVELGLIERLAAGPLTAANVPELPTESAHQLLRAAAALGLAERVGEHFYLGARGAALLGNPGIAEMVAHHRLLYADLADPVALLKRGGGGGQLAAYWRYAARPGTGSAGEVAGYSALMAASQALVARHVIDAYPFGRHRRVVDIGGGQGVFLGTLAARHPGLTLTLFDLPEVAARARESVAKVGGDFLAGPLPKGHDLVTLVRVLHDHNDADAARLLRNIHAALPPGGRLLIAEPMAETRGAGAMGDAYFGLYLLAMGSGRPRRKDEIAALLCDAGFGPALECATAIPLTVRVLIADKA